MPSFATTDLCDANEALIEAGRLQVVAPGYLSLGQRTEFHGPAVTLKVFEDNSLVRDLLEQSGHGRVLVVDGGGSLRCALVGGKLARLAVQNGWAGILVYGAVRDRAEIDAADIGVRALALHPQRSAKRGSGQGDLPVRFSGVSIRPGNWIYADADGILVSDAALG